MPSSNPQFLMDVLRKVYNGSGEQRAKQGNLTLEIKDWELEVYHFGTLILRADMESREVLSIGGAYSQTDSRYINCISNYFNLMGYARIKQGELGYEKESGEVLV